MGAYDLPVYTLGQPCPDCGETYFYDLLEWWSDPDPRNCAWQLDTCCEGAQEYLEECMEEALSLSAQERVRYLAPLARLLEEYLSSWADEPVHVRQLFVDPATLTLRIDNGLELEPAVWADAKSFVQEYHEHHRAPNGWRFGLQARNGGDVVAVAMVSHAIARGYNGTDTWEVTRLAARRDLASELRWNACSMLYSAAAKAAKAQGARKIITYTLADSEDGATLRAAGWVCEGRIKGRRWSCPSRPRADDHPTCDKLRWAKLLHKSATVQYTPMELRARKRAAKEAAAVARAA